MTLPYSALFPGVLMERILPADGAISIGNLFVEVLKMGKARFFVALEGSRIPLDLDIETSVLVGQRVEVKYLPCKCMAFAINKQ